jgi:hypothetical protein
LNIPEPLFWASLDQISGPAKTWLKTMVAGPDTIQDVATAWVANELFRIFPDNPLGVTGLMGVLVTPLKEVFTDETWLTTPATTVAPGLLVLGGRYVALTWVDWAFDMETGETVQNYKNRLPTAVWVRVCNLQALLQERHHNIQTTENRQNVTT